MKSISDMIKSTFMEQDFNLENIKNMYNGNPNIIYEKYTNHFDDQVTLMLFASMNSKLDIAKWIYSIDKKCIADVDNRQNTLMINACYNNNIEAVKWIHSVDPLQITKLNKNNISPFQWACKQNHIEIAKWFCAISKWSIPNTHVKYKIVMSKDKIIGYTECINNTTTKYKNGIVTRTIDNDFNADIDNQIKLLTENIVKLSNDFNDLKQQISTITKKHECDEYEHVEN